MGRREPPCQKSARFVQLLRYRLVTDRRTDTERQHWLPVSYRIRFKLCCLVHAIHYGSSPAYLMETVQSVGTSRSRSGLRSSSTSSMDYSLPRLRTKFGEPAFSHAGPATWNALPDHIRTVADPVKFRKLLKSHFALVKLLIFDDF